MRYLIIGLGIYGSNLARDLQKMGHEVVGVDINEARVDELKDVLATVYCVDTTEMSALNVLPYKDCDLVVVTIGENFGASVKTVALLKQAGVKHMYARAVDPLNKAILECFELDRILQPEQHAAADLAREMMLGTRITAMQLTEDTYIIKCPVSNFYEGKTYVTLVQDAMKTPFNDKQFLRVIAATRPVQTMSLLHVPTTKQAMLDISDPSVVAQDGDIITIMANTKAIHDLYGN